MNKSKIPYVTHSWSPVTGCSPISPGCQNCYAHTRAKRFLAGDFKPAFNMRRFNESPPGKPGAMIFVCPLGDLFHDDIPTEIIRSVIYRAVSMPQHTWLFLTKRAERMKIILSSFSLIPSSLWFGVSTENQEMFDVRWPILESIPNITGIKYISAEPLLGPITMEDARHVPDWVIAGPETGTHKRPCNPDWLTALKDECAENFTAYYDKRDTGLRQLPLKGLQS